MMDGSCVSSQRWAHMHERHVPAPGVDAGDAHTARGQIERRRAAHAAAGGEIFVAADAAGGARIDEDDIERLELVTDAFEFGFHFGRRDHMTVRHFAKIELDARAKKPVERHLIDGHHRLAVDRLRLKMNRRIHVRAVMRRQLDLFDCPGLAVRQVLAAQAGKQLHHKGCGLGIAAVGDFRPHERRVVDRFIFKRRREVDNPTRQFHSVPVQLLAQ